MTNMKRPNHPTTIDFEDTAFDIHFIGQGVVIVLWDHNDHIIFKVAFEEAEELMKRLPPEFNLDHNRKWHRIVYDYAVEKKFVRLSNSKKVAARPPCTQESK